MLDQTELLLAGATIVVVLGIYLAFRLVSGRVRSRVQQRLQKSTEESGILVRRPIAATSADASSRLNQGFDRLIERTGLDLAPHQALGIIALCGVVLGGGLYVWRDDVAFAIGGLLVGILAPLAVFWFLRGRQRRQLQAQLPDALYLLARSLRAGMTLEQSIQLVGDRGVKPLANEFRRCAASLQLGLPLTTALELMAERVPLLDFKAFVSTVAFQHTAGGNLPLLVDRLAASARDRNQFRGQFMASTAQGRISAVALASAAPLYLICYILFEPEHIRPFFSDPAGWIALGVAFALQVIGFVWLYRIMSIDY